MKIVHNKIPVKTVDYLTGPNGKTERYASVSFAMKIFITTIKPPHFAYKLLNNKNCNHKPRAQGTPCLLIMFECG